MLSKDVCWHYARYITILCIYIIPILAEYSFIYRYSITTCSASCSQVAVCQPLLKSYLTWFDLTDFSSVQCWTLITPSTDGSRHRHLTLPSRRLQHSVRRQTEASELNDWSWPGSVSWVSISASILDDRKAIRPHKPMPLIPQTWIKTRQHANNSNASCYVR